MESVDDLESPQTEETVAADTLEIDLDRIELDLADVEIALARLESGTYWTCEVTGNALSDELMESNPTARRLPSS